jgi:hypothetical protein
MGAGPIPELLHRILNLLAHARARFRLPPLTPFSRLFYTVLNLMKFGDHRGGMFVRARGVHDGRPSERSWHLLAEGDDGPFIPSMAVEGVIRKLMGGDRPAAGARAATRALELADYDLLFKGRSIYTGFRDDAAPRSLYRKLLGPAFNVLPAPVRALHAPAVERAWEGVARVKRGHGPFAHLIASVIGFPNEADEVPVTVTFAPDRGGERWTRTFGGRSFSSHQSCGSGRDQHLLVERFGIVTVSLALVVESERLYLVPRRWAVLGLTMPNALLPNGTSFESAKDGRFNFDVTISFPLVGLVAAYQGSLRLKD